MIEFTDLEKLGLNKNEAAVFIALLKIGEATAGDLIKKTGFHRNIVYDNLEKLADKSLINYIVKNGIRYYIISSSESILEIVKIKEEKVKEQYNIAKRLSKEIEKQFKKTEIKPKVQLFQGTIGVRDIMSDTLKVGEDYIVYGAPQESVKIMGEHFWENYTLKRKKRRIKVKMIFNEELKLFGKTIANAYTKIKYLSKRFDSLTETTVYGNKVAITVWTEKPITTLIEDENVAKVYKKYFEVLWKLAKK